MIIVSACLLGQSVRYKGDSCPQKLLLNPQIIKHLLPFCPECAGGLPTPRPPAEIQENGGGSAVLCGKAYVITSQGKNVSTAYCLGAQKCLDLSKKMNVSAAILKQGSPSCGTREIYDGSFSGKKIAGQGVTAALLSKHNIKLFGEDTLSEDLLNKLIKEDKI